MAEQLIRNEQVAGSIPVTSSIKRPSKLNGLLGLNITFWFYKKKAKTPIELIS